MRLNSAYTHDKRYKEAAPNRREATRRIRCDARERTRFGKHVIASATEATAKTGILIETHRSGWACHNLSTPISRDKMTKIPIGNTERMK
jgi:hypothetical protein